MEEMTSHRRLRRVTFVLSASILLGLILFVSAVLVVSLRQAGQETDARQEGWVRLALLSVGILGVLLVVLVAIVSRRLAGAVSRRRRLEPTEHLDAWAVAGRRFRLPPEQGDAEGPEGDAPDGEEHEDDEDD